jgi:hypothetical protein
LLPMAVSRPLRNRFEKVAATDGSGLASMAGIGLPRSNSQELGPLVRPPMATSWIRSGGAPTAALDVDLTIGVAAAAERQGPIRRRRRL